MSFIKDFFGDGDLIDIVAGGQADVADLFGRKGKRAGEEAAQVQEDAVNRAIEEERRAREEAQGFLSPFGGIGQRGVDLSSFLADPNAQFDFLQNNPLFQLALENANRTTQASSASRGRLSSGDTLNQLSNNVLLSASPLIDRQREDILSLLGIGTGIAQTQANVAIGEGTTVGGLLTDIGNVRTAGIAAGQQAEQQGFANAAQIAGAIFGGPAGAAAAGAAAGGSQTPPPSTGGGGFSDPRLKKNRKIIGNQNGFTLWAWDWNDIAEKLGLTGSSFGVMFDEVLIKQPEATSYKDGYGQVNYSMIGVNHGN